MAYKRGKNLINFSLFFRIMASIVFFCLWPIEYILVLVLYSVRYEGQKKLRRLKGGAVLVSNHTAYLDPIMVSGAALPRRIYQTLLEATVETPFLGTFTRLLGGVPLPPGMRGLEKLLETAKTAFRYRHFLHFYPEGELSLHNQQIERFKFGAFYVAAKLNLPIIPIVTIISQGRLKRRPKRTLVVLDTFNPQDFIKFTEQNNIDMHSVEEFAETVRRAMQNEIDVRHARKPRDGTQAFYKGKAARIKGIN
ncbi:MAG: 1-acyl-sn-glycerol-3-phosphate acyltransferase [Spirochaetaceae bacterium]|jgi:1-acyl-sn-glycerol-3-phosphate acyltransferase|nr:1-acyl-sn-glycerol-3-phosphate acyltransferase [Spirochaetaceae bacterium]